MRDLPSGSSHNLHRLTARRWHQESNLGQFVSNATAFNLILYWWNTKRVMRIMIIPCWCLECETLVHHPQGPTLAAAAELSSSRRNQPGRWGLESLCWPRPELPGESLGHCSLDPQVPGMLCEVTHLSMRTEKAQKLCLFCSFFLASAAPSLPAIVTWVSVSSQGSPG